MNRVIHFEIGAESPERAVKFYEDVFGWRAARWAGPQSYWLMNTGPDTEKGINGGVLRLEDGQPRIINTIEVESVEEYSNKVQQNGGQVVVPKFAVHGVGWQAYCKDTEGNIFGIHKPDAAAK